MNPKPLLALNHFTVPCSLNCVSLFCLSYLLLFPTASSQKNGPQVWTCSPSRNSKGFTRATNAKKVSHTSAQLSNQYGGPALAHASAVTHELSTLEE